MTIDTTSPQDMEIIGRIKEHERIMSLLEKTKSAHEGLSAYAEGSEHLLAQAKANVLKHVIAAIGGVGGKEGGCS